MSVAFRNKKGEMYSMELDSPLLALTVIDMLERDRIVGSASNGKCLRQSWRTLRRLHDK